jgi:CheY-like chemotaxis protein
MPDMDGVALTVSIADRDHQGSRPTVPGAPHDRYPTPEIEQRALAAGVDHFLAKPFLIEQFATMVRAALKQERAVGGRSGPVV